MYRQRIEKTRKKLSGVKIDALFVSSPSNIFYLTGQSQFMHPEDAFLLVTSKKCNLFTNPLYADGVQKNSEFDLCVIDRNNLLTTQINDFLKSEKSKRLGIESVHMSVALYNHLSKAIDVKFVPTYGVVESVRAQKDESEIHSIQKACRLTDNAFKFALSLLKKGITERELAFKIEVYMRENEGDLAFPIIAAFGPHSATPHHANTDTKLSKDSRVVLLDFGAKVDGYCSDLTRTVFVDTPSDAVTSTYNSLLSIQKDTINFAATQKIGSSMSEIAKYCDLQFEKEKLPSIPHALGHGLGIDVHEGPSVSIKSKDKFVDGAVFTIEPGIYVPGHLGIRIEDTVGVSGGKFTQFTKADKQKVVISL